MNGWQLLTVLTLGASAGLWVIGISMGVWIWLSADAYRAFAVALDANSIAPIWLGLAIGAIGPALGYGLIRGQQLTVGWMVARERRQLQNTFCEIEMALGTEKAQEYLAWKLDHMRRSVHAGRFDLFG